MLGMPTIGAKPLEPATGGCQSRMNLPEDAEPFAFGRDADIYSIDD